MSTTPEEATGIEIFEDSPERDKDSDTERQLSEGLANRDARLEHLKESIEARDKSLLDEIEERIRRGLTKNDEEDAGVKDAAKTPAPYTDPKDTKTICAKLQKKRVS